MELSIESSWQYVTWKVRDFFQLPSEIGYCLDSPEFPFSGDSYCLQLYPNGSQKYREGTTTELNLVRLTSTFPERSVSYIVGYRWGEGEGNEYDTYSAPSTSNYKLYFRRLVLEEERDIYVPDGTLTTLCCMRLKEQGTAGNPQAEEVESSDTKEDEKGLPGRGFVSCAVQTNVPDCVSCSIQTEVASTVIEKENPKDEEWPSLDIQDDTLLRERMKELLTKGKDHDLTICVQDKEFRAHRNILSARSPVFAMMLAHDTKENNTGTINIEDCDPESFDEFLLYVYSGRTENLTPNNALQLYYPADKYDFPVLKERCVSLLKTSLSVESICDVVLLAARHQEKGLLEVATEFFARNMKKIVVTVGWLKFLPQNPVEANELIIKSMEILNPEN